MFETAMGTNSANPSGLPHWEGSMMIARSGSMARMARAARCDSACH